MERNDQFSGSTSGAPGSSGATGGSGYTQSQGGGSQAQGASAPTPGGGGGRGTGNLADQAQNKLQQGKEAVTQRVGQVRDKATEFKTTLADKLESGADKLRQRGHESRPELAGTGGATAVVGDRLGQYSDTLATGMERTAGWLRDGDLGQVITEQVREHPARTLLIAVGLGYLVGRALKD